MKYTVNCISAFFKPLIGNVRLISRVFMILLLSFGGAVMAADEVKGQLGYWLNETTLPGLTELLSRHPRFKGETIKVSAMSDGNPGPIVDELTQQIRQVLTHHLLLEADVRIPYGDESSCGRSETQNVLGIEVAPTRDGEYTVTIAMIDTQEGVWINGALFRWSGRLERNQRQALGSRIESRTPLFDLSEASAIGLQLVRQLECQSDLIRRADAQPLYFAPSESSEGRSILRTVREQLAGKILMTPNAAEAVSTLLLKVPSVGAGVVSLELAGDKNRGTIRLAEVMSSGGRDSLEDKPVYQSRIDENDGPASREIDWDNGQSAGLISAPRVHYEGDRCRGEGANCVDVEFEIFEAAYLLQFYTRNGKPFALSCDMPVKERPGTSGVGLKIPQGRGGQAADLGFYVVAISERQDANRLYRRLARASRSCERKPIDPAIWAEAFAKDVTELGDLISWQSIHFRRDRAGISTL